MLRALTLLSFLLLCSIPTVLEGQTPGTASARIRVVDANSDDPIEGAQVAFPDL